MSMFLYAFREREAIGHQGTDLRPAMMSTYFPAGGVWRDVPVEFEKACVISR